MYHKAIKKRYLRATMSQSQHYVPQFYLRNFSNDQKNINIYNLSRQKYFSGPISKQCAKPNFYSESQDIEHAFSKFEGKVAHIIKKIIDNKTVPIDNQEYIELLSFILWQSGRTNKASQDMLKRANDIFDYLKPDLATMDEAKKIGWTLKDFEKIKVSHKNPALETSYQAISSAPLLFDLELVLLINKSKVEFITSDSPTALFNSFFNGKTKGYQTGYANKGLQIFFPLNPECMLVLYDPQYYEIPFKEDRTYLVKKDKDVRRLNGLQIIFCFNNIYFKNHKQIDLNQQHNNLKHKREEGTIIKSAVTPLKDNSYAELINFAKDNAIYNLSKLSFLFINPQADSNPGARNRDFLEEHRKQMRKLFHKTGK